MPQTLQTKLQELELRLKQLEEENKILVSGKNGRNNSKAILQRLKESEERYILSQTLAQMGSWSKDPMEEKIWASDEFFNLLGLEKDSGYLSLSQIVDVVHSDDVSKLQQAFADIHERSKKFDIEIKIVKQVKDDKELHIIQMVGVLLKNENDANVKIIGIVKDISEYKKNIKEIARARDKAEESDKLKTAFLANMSHDLRTPMNAIIGYSELLNLGNTNSQNRKEYSRIIKQKGVQLLTLIDDIIEVSKFETGTQGISRTEFSLNELLKEVNDIAHDKKMELGKENTNIHMKIPVTIHNDMLYTDSGRLQQVLINLLGNALKFTEKGFVEFGYTVEEDNKLMFYVKDTGRGLSKDQQRHIFNRFKNVEKTTKLKYSGSGLGLTLSKRIVELLGGKIWVESDVNQGSTFYFTLPIVKNEMNEDLDTVNENMDFTNLNWKDKVILIVEDEEVNYKFLETVLHDTQAQILYARDGLQAIDLCLSINKIDLILMDIKMPEMDGFEAAKRIKQFRNEIPIIAQTAFASRDDKLKSLKSGCDDYIAKPIEIELLISKINKFFADKDY